MGTRVGCGMPVRLGTSAPGCGVMMRGYRGATFTPGGTVRFRYTDACMLDHMPDGDIDRGGRVGEHPRWSAVGRRDPTSDTDQTTGSMLWLDRGRPGCGSRSNTSRLLALGGHWRHDVNTGDASVEDGEEWQMCDVAASALEQASAVRSHSHDASGPSIRVPNAGSV